MSSGTWQVPATRKVEKKAVPNGHHFNGIKFYHCSVDDKRTDFIVDVLELSALYALRARIAGAQGRGSFSNWKDMCFLLKADLL